MNIWRKLKNILNIQENINDYDGKNKSSKTNDINSENIFKEIPFEVHILYEGDKYKEEDFYEHSKQISLKIMNKPKDLYDCIVDEIIHQNKCWNKEINDNRQRIMDSIQIDKVDIHYEDDDINKCSDIFIYTKKTRFLLPPDLEDNELNYGYIEVYLNNEEFKDGTASSEWYC